VDPTPDPRRPHNCGNCHADIHREWAGSGHARSATNRRFRNLYDGTDWHGKPNVGWNMIADYPDGAGVCAACHSPTADPAGSFDLRDLTQGPPGLSGVHCDYCHKIQALAGGDIGLSHGRYNLSLLRPSKGQIFFGPLDDVDRGEDVFSPLQRDSKYCASCHEGTVFGVHVYGTYTEWLASPAAREGKQCQSCHMRPTGAMTNVAPGHGGVERDSRTLANHTFFAGSKEAMLRDALRLDLLAARAGDEVRAVVRVRADNVGHAVPTGFPDRNLVMVVQAFDADGRELPGGASRLYAKLLVGPDGKAPAPFWRADAAFRDTRLRPGVPDESLHSFPASAKSVRARLIYRRFWPEVADAKGWPDNETTVRDVRVEVPGG
jgi:hypothetical protein